MKKVSKQSPLPLYYQLKEIIQEMIENGEYKPGDPIPPERELCEIHSISRMTVNKAIMALVNEGVLYREQGKGTFVAQPKINHQLNRLKGFTEEMREKGLNTETEILSYEIKKATKENRINLNLDETQEMVIEIKRLRKVEKEPFSIETVWIPSDLCPDMNREMIENNSLYELLRKRYGYKLEYAKQTIEPINLDDYDSKLLNVDNNRLALLFRRTTFTDKGKPIEHTKAIYRGDKYKFEIVLRP